MVVDVGGRPSIRSAVVIAVCTIAGCGRVSFDLIAADGGDDTGPSSDGTLAPDAKPLPACGTTYQNALFCDDFEGGDLSKWILNLDGANTVVRDPAFTRSGSGAAHSRAVESGAARLIANVLGGAASGTLYVRFYQWVPQGPVIDDVSLVHLVSNITPYPGVVLALRNDQEFTVLSTINSTTGATTVLPLPRASWACVQVRLEIGTSGTVTTWINGAVAATYAGNTITPNGYRDFHIGVYLLGGAPLDAWLDDVVVDRVSVPCD